MLLGIKAKVGCPLLCIRCTNGLQDANGDHVLGFGQTRFEGHGSFKLAVIVLGFPGLRARHIGIKKEGRIVDDGGGGEALF